MKKKNITNIILIVMLLVGLSLLLYPSISDYWNSFHQSQAITSYVEQLVEIDEDKYIELWQDAIDYNDALANHNIYMLTPEQKKEYEKMLNISNSGVMGYIEIPQIKTSLPIYHGTDESVLQVAVGHLEWTSLPTGGKGTHCVISGHRGLPSAKLFSDLDQLAEGDIFVLRILNEVLTYEVDQILIVEPDDVSALHIDEEKDYVTLVTCTPYGINSHRLLVRGHRIDNLEESKKIHIVSDATQIEPLLVAPIVAMPILLVLLIQILLPKKKR